MKCPNCGYFNMPGATVCGSCRRALNETPDTPETAESYVPVAEIYPPRAKNRTAVQQIEAHSPTYRRARNAARRDVTQTKENWAQNKNRVFNLSLAWQWWWPPLASLVPGLGQILQRRVLSGAIFLAAAVLCLGLGFVALHSPLSNILFYAFLGVIGYSIFNAAQHSFPPPPDETTAFWRQCRLGLLSMTLVALLVVGFFGIVNLRYSLWTLTNNQAAPFLRLGDSLIVERFEEAPIAQLERSDVIVSRNAIERIIGLPGDRVTFHKGILSVNGRPLEQEQLPLTFRTNTLTFDVRVGANTVLIWRAPANFVQPEYAQGIQSYDVVPLDAIEGRLVGLYNPPARRRWIGRRNTQ